MAPRMMMRSVRLMTVTAALMAVAGCKDSPTAPSPETATFEAQLSPANEVPPVSNPEASGSGTVTVTMKINRDSGGAITSATADFAVSLVGFPVTTAISMAHIHRGAVGVVGPVVVDTGITLGEVVLVNGAGYFTKTGISVDPVLAQEILSGPAGFYFNVHSTLNAPGVARGHLVRK